MRRLLLKVALLAAPLALYSATVNYLEPGEVGIGWNLFTGEVTLQDHPGWHTTSPFTFVSTVETRPQRLCVLSSAQAAVNCRLVQFDERYYREFIAVEGWGYYWWANRFSFNSGHEETYRGFKDVLRGYAFSSQPYPFVRSLKEF